MEGSGEKWRRVFKTEWEGAERKGVYKVIGLCMID